MSAARVVMFMFLFRDVPNVSDFNSNSDIQTLNNELSEHCTTNYCKAAGLGSPCEFTLTSLSQSLLV
jgi:hypothetical protein